MISRGTSHLSVTSARVSRSQTNKRFIPAQSCQVSVVVLWMWEKNIVRDYYALQPRFSSSGDTGWRHNSSGKSVALCLNTDFWGKDFTVCEVLCLCLVSAAHRCTFLLCLPGWDGLHCRTGWPISVCRFRVVQHPPNLCQFFFFFLVTGCFFQVC